MKTEWRGSKLHEKPNIILITCDQLRADAIGCAPNATVQTPHIDFLARRGTRFTHAFSTTPVCIPARAIIMTGMEGYSLGNTGGKAGYYELPFKQTMPQQLSDAGYQTQVVGKMHVYPERCHYGFHNMVLWEEGRPFGRATDRMRGYGDYEDWLAEQGYAGQAFAHGMANNEYSMSPWHLPDHLHPTEWIGYESCKAIKRRDWTRPFFLWASFTAPHPPLVPLMRDLVHYSDFQAPEQVKGNWYDNQPLFHQKKLAQHDEQFMSEQRRTQAYRAYYALVTQVDRQINRLIGTLREEGMLDNTWFVFTADHGDNLGDHGLWAKSNFLQGASHIPFIVTPPIRGDLNRHVPRNWIPGSTSSAVVGLQDIMPTILDIAGATVPDHLEGHSLIPLIKQRNSEVRESILGEFGQIGKRSFMLTDGNWKYIWYEQDGIELLFHISEDPQERINVADEQTQQCELWRNKLIYLLEQRSEERAVSDGKLAASEPGRVLQQVDRSRFVNDLLPRGIH